MITIQEVIVVEGKTDVATLSNIIKAEYIITNGFEISEETIELIKRVNETKGVILFLDPDGPGEKIRMKIMNKIPNLKHAFVNPKYAKKGKKLGVAETDKEHILEALENIVTLKEREISISYLNFFELELVGFNNSLEKRLKIEDYYRIGHGSAKTCLKRLNMLGITYEELKKVVNNL
jgi:ribonuclease M5